MKRIASLILLALIVTVSPPCNAAYAAPTASAGVDMTVLTGSLNHLDGFYSSVSDGAIASYSWRQTAGPTVVLSDPAAIDPVFKAPSSPTTLTFELTVTDTGGAKSSDTCNVVVVSPAGAAPPPTDTTPPTVSITSPASGARVSGSVTLSATATDNVGVTKVEFYSGSTQLGTGANTSGSTWQYDWNTSSVPNGSYSLTAKAYDAAGNTKTSSAVTVTVQNRTPPNQRPVANAGPDQRVRSGATVRLTGAASTDDRGIVSYRWVKISGPSVALSGANSVNASFVAPRVTTGSVTLTFRLTVTDAGRLSSTDTVNIIVTPSREVEDDD
jgi:large repetitive protein